MRLLIETAPVDGGEPVVLEVVHAGCDPDTCLYCTPRGVLPAGEYSGPDPRVSVLQRYEGGRP